MPRSASPESINADLAELALECCSVDGGIKDMQSMLAEATARGISLPLVERTLACYEETKRHRSGAAEISTVSVYWATRGKR